MKTTDFESWEEFEESLSPYFDRLRELRKEKYPLGVSIPLFRGHSNASWKLQTTLERFTDRRFSEFNYYEAIRSVNPAVVSITGKEWPLPKFEKDDLVPMLTGNGFMVYLRHHGFPSPLLDWTRSPYVAAFFAFRSQQVPKDGRVAIYSYVEFAGKGKCQDERSPFVYGTGAYVETHKRHYAQQCEYTICVKRDKGNFVYHNHEFAFEDERSDQGELKKVTLPASERTKALKQLQRMNVTAFSLFGNEESLMETLAYQKIEETSETE